MSPPELASALDRAVRELVAERTGLRPTGPIRLLTNLRTLGVVMNPVSFYFCFAADGERVEAIVAEVTNTPWNERHAYVLAAPRDQPAGATQRFALPKQFHVSPFMEMGLDYDWRFSSPGRRLVVHMENHGPQGKTFDATLVLAREPLTGPHLARAPWRHPWISAQIVWRIDWQALRLYLIEMIEAVGHRYFKTYFERCASFLKPHGRMAIQAITIADPLYDAARREADFIKRYIFPGSTLPSLTTLCQAASRTDLRLTSAVDIGHHYAETLRRWCANFRARWPHLVALGFEERLLRLWELYFCYCEGGFAEGVLGDVQLAFAKPQAMTDRPLPNSHLAREAA